MNQNPFEILNIRIGFDISEDMLLYNYQEMMRTAHPDQYPTKPEKEYAIMKSIAINQAFEKLKDPIKRAETILELAHINIIDAQIQKDLLEEILYIQEMNDFNTAQKEFDTAKVSFAKAFKDRNSQALKKNFLIMKYLARFLQNKQRSETI